MPFALFLQQSLQLFAKGSRSFAPWAELVHVESLLIDRARSAFLVHWFGDRLPLHGFSVRVVIDNLAALATRYRQLLAESRFRPEGLSLAEPLGGLAGNLAGALLSPGGAIAFTFGVIRFLWRSGGVLIGLLGSLVLGPLLSAGGVVVGALAPLGVGLGLVLSAAKDEVVAEVFRLLESAARMIGALNGLIDQLLGPRSGVRNPLLRSLLSVFDSIAGLLAQLLGAVAIIVTRLGPLIIPWTLQILAFKRLFAGVADLIREMVVTAVERIKSLLDNRSPLYLLGFYFYILDAIERAIPRMLGHIGTLILRASAILLVGLLRYLPELARWINSLRDVAERHFVDHFVTQQILGAIRQIRNVISIFAPLVSSGPPSGGSAPSTGSPGSSGLPSLPFAPPPPALPALPTTGKVASAAGGAPPFGLSLDAIENVADLLPADLVEAPFRFGKAEAARIKALRRSPPSVFAGERLRIQRELAARGRGPTPDDAFKQIRREETRLRQLLFNVVGNVLPPRLRAEHFPTLLDTFRDIDHYVHDGRRGPRGTRSQEEFPVRDLPDNGLLLPRIEHMNIEATGWERDEVERFRDRLVAELGREPYQPDPALSPSPTSPTPVAAAAG